MSELERLAELERQNTALSGRLDRLAGGSGPEVNLWEPPLEPYRLPSPRVLAAVAGDALTVRAGAVVMVWVRFLEEPPRSSLNYESAIAHIGQVKAAVAAFEAEVRAGRVPAGTAGPDGVVRAELAPTRHGSPIWYSPTTGARVTAEWPPEGAGAPWKEYARREWYIQAVEGWLTLDLYGVRVAPLRPTLYGVHDGLCPCHGETGFAADPAILALTCAPAAGPARAVPVAVPSDGPPPLETAVGRRVR